MSSSNWNSTARDPEATRPGGTVAAYFTNGEDAHRAINDLLEQGFGSREIGAAFHSGESSFPTPSSSASGLGKNDAPSRSAGRRGTTTAGAGSDTNAVTPSGLATGGGTVVSGPTPPGPIPGSDIPSNLPKEVPSEFASTAGAATSKGENLPATGGFHQTREHASWWTKLKHIFGGGESTDATARREPMSESRQNFGTGEGHLGTYQNRDYSYSGSAFESSFSGMGIPQENARRLSRELGRGGAVVTVRAGLRDADAEKIMERNHGVIRYEMESNTEESAWDAGNQNERVEIFGEIHRVYPSHIPEEDVPERKAS